jgi:hypothetical protein
VAGREEAKLLSDGDCTLGSRSIETRLEWEGRRVEGEKVFGSVVGWPNTKPLAAAAIAVPVPIRLGTVCMVASIAKEAEGSTQERDITQRQAF